MDTTHSVECITSIESDFIRNSFKSVVKDVYLFNSENMFISSISEIKENYSNVLVYSMAQNINGVGRRSLIPLLCDYYHLINIGSSFLESTISGNKRLMHKILEKDFSSILPKTYFCSKTTNFDNISLELFDMESIILKPIDESASIGVKLIKNIIHNDLVGILKNYATTYPEFIIQEFISGRELEVTLVFDGNQYYCPGIAEIISDHEYLSYDVIGMEDYDFSCYTEEHFERIISVAKSAARTLGFKTICRIDFILDNTNLYIIDLGSNPTVSGFSSSNFIFTNQFKNNGAIYKILPYLALYKNNLLKPPFNQP